MKEGRREGVGKELNRKFVCLHSGHIAGKFRPVCALLCLVQYPLPGGLKQLTVVSRETCGA